MPPAEARLWTLLRGEQFKPFHFRRQVPIGRYFADFASHGARLVIEVDGDTHGGDEVIARDAVREEFLRSEGYEVLRVTNLDVMNHLEGVASAILVRLAAAPTRPGFAGPPSPQGGRRKPPAYTLRDATPDDADWINWLEEQCMRAYAEALWGAWHSSIEKYGFDPDRHRIVVVDGVECGVIDVRREEDHHFLGKLYIAEIMRGEGLGAALLKQVREEAAAAGKPLRLSVITTNPRALAFYKREGFSEISRTNERILMQRGF